MEKIKVNKEIIEEMKNTIIDDETGSTEYDLAELMGVIKNLVIE